MTPGATGGCLCGGLRFRVSGEPKYVAYCHCVDCRRASGAPVSALAGYDWTDVELLGEAPRTYTSSPGVTRSFCGVCGGTFAYEDERLPGEVYIFVGLFDDPEPLAPRTHSWHSQAVSWLRLDYELPRHETSSKPRPGR